ncbi:MAG: hypothetical protein ABJF10_22865 [Chthoniobacter sp.]|uniref:hypothetical protein n=1 Tax=Chthoniobacter sp. TaxID=2510640 RepID=UPI0032A63673
MNIKTPLIVRRAIQVACILVFGLLSACGKPGVQFVGKWRWTGEGNGPNPFEIIQSGDGYLMIDGVDKNDKTPAEMKEGKLVLRTGASMEYLKASDHLGMQGWGEFERVK